jgi:hypothetical protein
MNRVIDPLVVFRGKTREFRIRIRRYGFSFRLDFLKLGLECHQAR